MKIRANIKYPPPKFETRDLTFEEACKLVDALTNELVVTNRQLGTCEAMLERCKDHLKYDTANGTPSTRSKATEERLIREIEEVLK